MATGQPIDGKGPFQGGTLFCVENNHYINPMTRPPIRERMEFSEWPKAFEGFPIALVAAGLIALAFMGFSGLKVFG